LLVATAIVDLFLVLFSAAGGAVALTEGVAGVPSNLETIGSLGIIIMLAILGVAYYAGGYVAGRMSRFDGARQGFGVWAVGIAMALLMALAATLFGTAFNLLQQLNLPYIPVNQESLTVGGVAVLLLGLAVALLAAMAGAKQGELYHRLVDAAGDTEIRDAEEPRYTGSRTQPSFGERIGPRPGRRGKRLELH
jgi:hypothetical protein